MHDQSTEKGEEQKIKKEIEKMSAQRESRLSNLPTTKVAPIKESKKMSNQL